VDFLKLSSIFDVREKKIDGRINGKRKRWKQLDDERILFVLRENNIRMQEPLRLVLITFGSAFR